MVTVASTPSMDGASPLLGADASVEDYFALLKPRVMSLVVFTALVGMAIAPAGGLHPVLAAISLLAIAVGSGASGALNMWWDADIDAVMERTRNRPVAAGRIAPHAALAFGIALSVGSVLVLGLAANWVAAGLLAFTIWFYAYFYTIVLKRRTVQNIVIGGAAAFPPVIGWAAMTGDVAVAPLVLFAIIFLWTPPHFWALAILKNDDYSRAGVPMMPVVAGAAATRRQMLLYVLVLLPVGVLPYFLGFAGYVYLGVSTVFGALFLLSSVNVLRHQEGPRADRACGQMFAFSILYLFVLFATILAERLLGLA